MGRNKSKSKQIEKRRNQRENAEFDAIELENVEYAKPVAVVNGGPSFNSKKFKKQNSKTLSFPCTKNQRFFDVSFWAVFGPRDP